MAEGTAERERERKPEPDPEQAREQISEHLDAGGAIQLPKYEHPVAPQDEPEP